MNMHVGFKRGDRVRAINDSHGGGYTKGKIYTVSEFSVAPYGGNRIATESDDGGNRYNDWNADNFELAPRFAVGDRVRVVKNTRAVSFVGQTGIVAASSNVNGVCVDIEGTGQRYFDAEEIELLPATYTSCAAAEVDNLADEYGGGRATADYKAGDKFRVIKLGEGGSFHGAKVGDVFEVTEVYDTGETEVHTDKWFFHPNEIEPVAVAPATATLTIQAGRYYKTRDGRKVGPMEWRNTYGSAFTWQYGNGRRIFMPDGTNFDGPNSPEDLIAEWSDTSDDVPLRGVSPVVAPATTAKFKVGDRVKCLRNNGAPAYFTIGRTYTVSRVETTTAHSSGLLVSCFPDVPNSYGVTSAVGQFGDAWELIPATTIADIVRKHSGTAIVCLIENGQPKPSTLPFVHYSSSAAATEANRLAGIHRGKEFGVYECVDVRKVERVYDHEWQRLAARGSKISAIKALRDLAGIDLAAAKSGVDQFLVRAA